MQLIKEKLEMNIKGRACANDNTQRDYIPAENGVPPTVSIEALVILVNIIDTHECRFVATCDIIEVFLN